MDQELKEIIKQELKASGDKLKAVGVDLGKEALELVAIEMSDMIGRIVAKTPNKVDDFYNVVKPMLDAELNKIHSEN